MTNWEKIILPYLTTKDFQNIYKSIRSTENWSRDKDLTIWKEENRNTFQM